MTDRAAEAAAELYGADPDEFTTRRGELAKAARAAGDAAKRIGALRKPTRPAWLVNRLVRARAGGRAPEPRHEGGDAPAGRRVARGGGA